MHCSRCGFDNPEGMNFCGKCAAPLSLHCPQCGFENPPGFAFCGKCATPLTSQPPASYLHVAADSQRRLASSTMEHLRHRVGVLCGYERSGLLSRGKIVHASSLRIQYEPRVRRNDMIFELDIVVLTHDIEEQGLKQGDVGTVVHGYSDGMAFEVEFVTAEGRTVALLTLTQADIRLMRSGEILHVREFVPV
ncbi:MAG: DUF4926 domain-containing protein [Candidatus Tectomicrobia bacterium]|nr:DUF4926 domain-containing protein [Candidatus Tectomicrobia bacterium]